MLTSFRLACALASMLLLAACASPYAQHTLTGGYSDQKITETSWRVTYSGNGYTNGDMVVNYWLHRCAELTIQNGFAYFGLIPGSSPRSDGQAIPEDPVAAGGDARMVPVRGGSAPTYIYVPSYGGSSVTRWSKTGIILMYHTRLAAITPGQATALHAQTVLDLLKPYVASGGKEGALSPREVIKAAMPLTDAPTTPSGTRL